MTTAVPVCAFCGSPETLRTLASWAPMHELTFASIAADAEGKTSTNLLCCARCQAGGGRRVFYCSRCVFLLLLENGWLTINLSVDHASSQITKLTS